MRAPTAGRAGGGMRRGGAEVRRPPRRRHLGGEPFEFPAADVLQLAASGIRRRFFVEIHRHVEPLGDRRRRPSWPAPRSRPSSRLRSGRTGTTSTAPSRGMLAAMGAEVDVGDGPFEERQHGLFERTIADEREDRAVVRRVGGVVEQAHAGHARERRRPIGRRPSGRRPSLTLGTHSINMEWQDGRIRLQDAIVILQSCSSPSCNAIIPLLSSIYVRSASHRPSRLVLTPRRKRIATRRSSSSCSSASITTSPRNTTRRSTSGRARSSSIAAMRGRAPTSSGRAARWPSGSASPRSCCRTASPRSSAARATKRGACCRPRSTAARRPRKRSRCSIG